MTELIKALPCGALLAGITALFIGHGGGMGGTLAIEQMQIMDQSFFWSWPIFLGGTALAWGIMAIQN